MGWLSCAQPDQFPKNEPQKRIKKSSAAAQRRKREEPTFVIQRSAAFSILIQFVLQEEKKLYIIYMCVCAGDSIGYSDILLGPPRVIRLCPSGTVVVFPHLLARLHSPFFDLAFFLNIYTILPP